MDSSIQVSINTYGPFQRISMLREDARFPRPPQLSVYRVGDTLIDTGSSLTAHALVQALQSRPPRRIICTHQHEDHVGGVAAIRAAFGSLPLYVPRPHLPLLLDFDRVTEYRAQFWGQPSPITDAIPYDAGDVFEDNRIQIETVETPGHTPGHISLLTRSKDEVHVLSGDLYTSSPFVAWFESSAPCLVQSCRCLAGLAKTVVMLPTHGRVRPDGAEALQALVQKVEPVCERVEQTAHRLHVMQDSPIPTADYWKVADEMFGPDSGYGARSEGEWSNACFVRSVLNPVRTLPVQPLPPPGACDPAGHP